MNEILLALIAALGAMVPTWIVARRTPRRLRTEEAVVAGAAGELATASAGAAAGLVKLLTDEVGRLHTKVTATEAEADQYEMQLERCHRALRAAGIDPAGVIA